MAIGLVGRKCGMTRVNTDDGRSIPVSVIEVLPNKVTQLKNKQKDGYYAVQITTGHSRRKAKPNKPQAGHFAKASVEAGIGLWEFRLIDEQALTAFQLGTDITVDLFEVGQLVDVTGQTKGKGFAGVIKRWAFRSQDKTHGNSRAHKAPGSIGQRQSPGRVFKGKKMAGHLGDVQRTIQSLEVVRVDKERNLLLIKGAIPGAINGMVIIHPAVKSAQSEGGKSGVNSDAA